MSNGAITPEELAELTEMGSEPERASSSMPPMPSMVSARPVQFTPLQPGQQSGAPANLDLLLNVSLRVTVELGRARLTIEDILRLGPGSVVELDKAAGEPVGVLVNDRPIARGEVVVIEDRFGVRITEVLSPAQRINSLR
jgi:flagellar motor switch protein FliN/FliY